MRLKKLLPVAVGGGLGGPILIFVLIMAFYPNLFVSGIIKKKLATEFGGKVEAGKIFFGWKSGVEISNLFIRDAEYEQPLLKADSVHLKFAILPFLKDKLIIQRLVVNHPEMTIHREVPENQKESRLDIPSKLMVAGSVIGALADFSGDKYAFSEICANLPDIIEAHINNGTFIFTDLDSGQSTKLETFNLTLTGLRPGSTARVNGECDIIGGDDKDHAVISGSIQGFDFTGLTPLVGELAFKSGFADVQILLNLSGLNKPDSEIIASVVKVDFGKILARLGAVLALPDDVRISGTLDSEAKVRVQPEGSMLLNGTASSNNLYLQAVGLSGEPIQAANASVSYEVGVNPKEKIAKVQKLDLSVDGINLALSGEVHADGAFNTKVRLSAPLEELIVKFRDKYRSLAGVVITGDLTGDTEIRGMLGDMTTLTGVSRITDLDLMVGSIQYDDQEVTVKYALDYDQKNGLVSIRTVEIGDGILVMKLGQCAVQLGENGYYQGDLDLSTDIQKVGRLLKAPEFLQLEGVGTLYLDFKGRFTSPFYDGLRVSGTLGVDKAVYESYKITEISVDELTVKDNRLDVVLSMLVNGAPAGAMLDLDLVQKVANIERLFINSDKVDLELSGAVSGNGRIKSKIHATAPLGDVKNVFVQRYASLGGLNAAGATSSDIEIEGTIGDVALLNGSTRIEALTLEYEDYRYSDSEVTLKYALDYSIPDETVHIKNGKIVSNLLSSELEDVSITLRDSGLFQGKLDLDCKMEEMAGVYGVPAPFKLRGTGKVNLDFNGPITKSFYKDISASGSMALEEVAYGGPCVKIQISNITSKGLTVENNCLKARLAMQLNGVPANAALDADLALGRVGGPYIKTELHASRVPVTYTMEGGDLSGLVTLDVNEAEAEGVEWNETFRKTLAAKGDVKVEEGVVSATEILSTVFMGIAEPGVAQHIELVTSDFSVKDEKVYTEEFYMKGAPFDLTLSGWIGFDKQVDYDAVVLLSGKKHKGVQKVFRKVIKDSPIPLKITGQLPDPKIQFVGDAKLKSILITEKVLQGNEAIVRGTLGVPKKAIGVPTGILKKTFGVFSGPSKDSKDSEETPEGPANNSKQPE
ncbi:MAG: AsmA-like C-terminal region-containing protein [Candidatus Brocadiales bacterium]|nr:AsmA-like C-terminal region-containing protein [Candidatus Brocadiales bacterium]